jgi:predicted hydrocarbon binding protein
MALAGLEVRKTTTGLKHLGNESVKFSAKLKAIPTNIKISVAFAALTLAADAGELLGRKLSELSDASEHANKIQEDYNRTLAREVDQLKLNIDAYDEFRNTKVKSDKEISELDSKSLQAYKEKLQGLRAYQVELNKIALREEALGTGTYSSVKKSQEAVADTTEALSKLEDAMFRAGEAAEKGLSLKVYDLVSSFDQVKKTTKSTSEALKELFNQDTITSVKGTEDLAKAFAYLSTTTKTAGNDLGANINEKLKKLGVTFSDVNGEMKLTADELSKNLAPALRGVSTG